MATATDGGPPVGDGGAGDGASEAAACTDCLATPISWGDTGGNAPFVDASSLGATLGSCRSYARTRTGQSMLSCTTELNACGAAPIAIDDVEKAVGHPDVVAALQAGAPPLYGSDSRPVDGSVFHVDVGGKAFDVGGECGTAGGSCVAIPPGVSALVLRLRGVDTQELAKAACVALK